MISKLLCTDVLAIRCIGNFIFVGIGCTLHVFNKRTYELETKIRCLYPRHIHGIVDGPNNKLAVYGANFVCTYNVNTKDEVLAIEDCSSTKKLHDWIITTKWILIDDCIYLSILLAHNEIYMQDVSNEQHRSMQCEEKCILYGGSISVKSNKDLVIFSGTVFQEILIWEVKHDANIKSTPVLHRLKGHNGVIFSVIYDPLTQLICSTSDDRTVRLWKVSNNVPTKTDDIDWGQTEVKLFKTMFGHTARVWRSIITNEALITIGEDSLICTWSLDGKLLNKVCAHLGAAIWSIDISDDRKSILTGGADGAVYMWPFMSSYTQNKILLPMNNMCHVPKYITYLSSGTLVIYNEDGVIYCYDRMKKYPRESLHLQRYSNYCVMQVSQCRSYVSFASRDGYISIYKETDSANNNKLLRVLEDKIMESQILSLQWLQSDTIVVCGENGILKIFDFAMEGSTHVRSVCTLPSSRERWLTAAIIFEELLVCGDRAGNMHVFKLPEFEMPNQTPKIEKENKPVQTLVKIHGKIGIQNFTILDSKLMSTGRDGMLRFYELCKTGQKLLCILHKKKMPMDWISGTLKTSDDVFVLGFKEVEFVIYSMLHHRVVTRVPCGGGHRSWDCMLMNESITFAYIRCKQIFVFDASLCSSISPVLWNGSHTKEICCIQPVLQSNRENIFISGGEDGTLRLTNVLNTQHKDALTFQTLGVFDGHVSSIKSIAVTKLNSDPTCNKCLVFSGGGRAQIKVWQVDIKCSKSKLQNTNVSCSDMTSHMLYGLDRQRRKPCQEASRSYVMQPETRYMDIHVYCFSKSLNCMLLFVACADGCVRIFLYDSGRNRLDLKVCAKYVDRCILRMHVINCEKKVIALTMSTDGIVRFIDFTDVVEKIVQNLQQDNQEAQSYTDAPFAKFNLHQSGINSFDLKKITETEYLLATGGDDNLFSLVSFKISTTNNDKEPMVSLLTKWNTSSAHSAQITGIKFKDENEIYSVGIDQQVVVYNYKYHNGVVHAKTVTGVSTFVTDVQGLLLWSSKDESHVCVYGKGFEILSS